MKVDDLMYDFFVAGFNSRTKCPLVAAITVQIWAPVDSQVGANSKVIRKLEEDGQWYDEMPSRQGEYCNLLLRSWVFLEMVEKISSAERGEHVSNDKNAGATDGSTDKGEVVVNQETETTDGSAEKGALVMNDSPMLENKIINNSSALELVTEAIDDVKLDSEVSDCIDIRELIKADTSSETKNTIDSLESVETVVVVNKSGSITSEAQIGNANTKCFVKSGELTSLDATIFECETSDASIMEALQTDTGKFFVEAERLAYAIRSDSVEIEEIRSSSVEDVKPEVEPEIDFGKSGQNIATSLQKDVKTGGEVSLHFCENTSNLSVNPGDSLEVEVEFGNLCVELECNDEVATGESLPSCSINEVKSGVEVTNRYIEKAERVSVQASGATELISVERNLCLPTAPVDGFGSEAKFQKESVESSEYKPLALVDDVKVESDSTATSVIEYEDSLTNRNGDEKLISEVVGGLLEVHPTSQEDSTAASLVAQRTLKCWTTITLGHWIRGYLAALGFFHKLFCAAAVALQQPVLPLVALLKPVMPASQANNVVVAVQHTLLLGSRAKVLLEDADGYFHAIKALNRSAGKGKYDSSGAVFSAYASGVALEPLVGALTLAGAEVDQSVIGIVYFFCSWSGIETSTVSPLLSTVNEMEDILQQDRNEYERAFSLGCTPLLVSLTSRMVSNGAQLVLPLTGSNNAVIVVFDIEVGESAKAVDVMRFLPKEYLAASLQEESAKIAEMYIMCDAESSQSQGAGQDVLLACWKSVGSATLPMGGHREQQFHTSPGLMEGRDATWGDVATFGMPPYIDSSLISFSKKINKRRQG